MNETLNETLNGNQYTDEEHDDDIIFISDDEIEDVIREIELFGENKTMKPDQMTAVSQTHNVTNINTTYQPPSTDCMQLLKCKYFWCRIAILLVAMFSICLTIAYAIGQISFLSLKDFFCSPKTIQEIRAHSLKNNYPKGTHHGCWSTRKFSIDDSKLWTVASYGVDYRLDSQNKPQFALLCAMAVMFACLIIFLLHSLVSDVINHRKGSLGTQITTSNNGSANKLSDCIRNLKAKTNGNKKSKNLCKCSRLKSLISCFKQGTDMDSAFCLAYNIFREIMEITLQFQALLLYNGTTYTTNSNSVLLADDPQFVVLFAVFLSANCVFTGVLWILYAFQPNLCRNVLFALVLYANDTVFEIFYAIYPLIVVLSADSRFDVALGALQTKTQLSFWAIFIPLILLFRKCFSLSQKARDAMLEQFINANSDSNLSAKHVSTISTDNQQSPQSWIVYLSFRHSNGRKLYFSILSFVFIATGIAILSFVSIHFTNAQTHCASVADQVKSIYSENTFDYNSAVHTLLNDNKELILWDYCERKVYPFDDVCNCRLFRAKLYKYPFKLNGTLIIELYNISMVDVGTRVLQKWQMLEKFKFSGINLLYSPQTPKLMNFSKNMFGANKMKVFEMYEISVGYMDNAIQNWNILEYFAFRSTAIATLPNAMDQLTSLKYIWWTDNTNVVSFPMAFCSFTKLKAIDLRLFSIETIPKCVSNWKEIESIVFAYFIALESIPLDMFALPNLQALYMPGSSITMNGLMEYNNVTDINEFDEIFEWNDGVNQTDYQFERSIFCDNNQSTKFKQFIENTKCCEFDGCGDESDSETLLCWSLLWRDGACDDACFSAQCGWDGFDCIQTCDSDECTYDWIGDSVCDDVCDNNQCNWDGNDCLSQNNYTNCIESYNDTHLCDIEWISDGWCDSQCNNVDCVNDGRDCDSCKSECRSAWAIFEYVANSENNDNLVSSSEICASWGLLSFYVNEDDYNITFNCSTVIEQFGGDTNGDQMLGFGEFLQWEAFVEIFGLDTEKALQLNCSSCVH